MINPNNKEAAAPNLLSGFTAKEVEEAFRVMGQQPDPISPELEALNKSMEARAANWEYFKQAYAAASAQPDPIPNQSKPIVDSVVEELLKRKQIGDSVVHPQHYNQGSIECLDAIAAAGHAESFCVGSCLKYLWRYKHKNGIEDLKKAQFYLNWYIDYLQRSKTNK